MQFSMIRSSLSSISERNADSAAEIIAGGQILLPQIPDDFGYVASGGRTTVERLGAWVLQRAANLPAKYGLGRWLVFIPRMHDR